MGKKTPVRVWMREEVANGSEGWVLDSSFDGGVEYVRGDLYKQMEIEYEEMLEEFMEGR